MEYTRLNYEGFEEFLDTERTLNGGFQYLFKFQNGYGASVVKHHGSYGAYDDLFELGVVKFAADGSWKLDYDTEITYDVLGWLENQEVLDLLKQIKELK